MEKAHEGMNLQPAHYDAIVKHLSETLREFKVEEADIREIIAKIDTLRDSILYK